MHTLECKGEPELPQRLHPQESQMPALSLTVEMMQVNASPPGNGPQRQPLDPQMKSVLKKLGSSEPQIMWIEHWDLGESKAAREGSSSETD